MKNIIARLISHPLISGSSVIFLGTMTANILSYIFNLFMGRMLTVEDYGLLMALTSFFGLFGVFRGTFSKIFARYSSMYLANKDTVSLYNLITTGGKLSLLFSVLLCVLLLPLSPSLMRFLLVKNFMYMVLIYVAIFFSIIITLPQGIFQGLLYFGISSILMVLMPVIKLIGGLLFVYLGFGVFGAVFGLILSLIIPTIIFYRILLNKVNNNIYFKIRKEEKQEMRAYVDYGKMYFLATLGMVLLSNTDILLVRFFLKEVTSGQYAALSIMGKAIFYLTTPIGFVLFPLIAYKKEKKEKLFKTIILAILLIVLASLPFSFVYFRFPNIVLSLFFPADAYKPLATILGPFSLYILLFSLITLLHSFFLSIGKTDIYKITFFAACFQIIFIILFHNSLMQILSVLFITSFFVFILFIIFYIQHARDEKLFKENVSL